MNNFKVLMNGIIKENPTFCAPAGMCPTIGYNFFGHQWYGYGTGLLCLCVGFARTW